jgi:hypothetical protein
MSKRVGDLSQAELRRTITAGVTLGILAAGFVSGAVLVVLRLLLS